MKNKLLIDCQALQGYSLKRGIGKYSINLLNNIFHLLEKDEFVIYLLFNKNLINDYSNRIDEVVLEVTREVAIDVKKIILDLPTKRYKHKNYVNALTLGLSEIGSTSLNDIFFILSNFESDAASGFPNKEISKYMICYDIIPHLFPEIYLQQAKETYYHDFANLYYADKIFTISDTVKNDLVIHAKIDETKLVSIKGGPIYTPQSLKSEEKINENIGNLNNYIFFPGGDDWRKNNEYVVKNFISFIKKFNIDLKLVILSNYSTYSQTNILKFCPNELISKIIFAGYVNDSELNYLYEHAKLIIFPSKAEGLGLPVLEAVSYMKPIITSNLEIFTEISSKAFYYCNPFQEESLLASFENAMRDNFILSTKKKNEYANILNNYMWEKSAGKFLIEARKSGQKRVPVIRKKIAIFGPILTSYSGIGKYCESLIYNLSKYAEVTYYYDDGFYANEYRQTTMEYAFDIKDIREINLNQLKSFDTIIYNLGNNEFHISMLKYVLAYPGYVILHDIKLDGLYFLANRAETINRRIFLNEKKITKIIRNENYLYSIIKSSIGIIVHSKFAENEVKKIDPQANVFVLDLIIEVPVKSDKFNGTNICVGLAGVLGESKGISQFSKIANEFEKYDNLSFKIFGFDPYKRIVSDSINRTKNCQLKVNLTDWEWEYELQSLSLMVNFRSVYRGETSYTLLSAMKYGVPTVVKDIGWFAEIPSKCVIKINRFNEISNIIKGLIKDRDIYNNIGNNGYKLIRADYSRTSFIKQLIRIISKKYTNKPYKRITKLKGYVILNNKGLIRSLEG